jgi:hypothetical protein
MILRVDTNAKTKELVGVDDCSGIRVEVTGSMKAVDIDEVISGTGRLFGDNAWINLEELEAMAAGQAGDGWAADFRNMIDAASRQGQLNDERDYILAPVTPA